MRHIKEACFTIGAYSFFALYFLFLLIAITIVWYVRPSMLPGRAPHFDPSTKTMQP